MKRLLLLLTLSFGLGSCSDSEDRYYTGRTLEVELFQASTYAYKGKVEFKEVEGGGLELALRLDGAKSYSNEAYPAHLHFGSYNQANTPIAQILNPVSSSNLESLTLLGPLSDGSNLRFEDLATFDGHLKIHLANEGPDYSVILVAGNLGPKSKADFDPNQVALCGKTF